MTKTSFLLRASQVIESVFDQISEQESLEDFDVDRVGDVLTMDFGDGKKMILNIQAAANQLWLASPEGPAHFNYDETDGQWCNDRTGETLDDVISRVLSAESGKNIIITPDE